MSTAEVMKSEPRILSLWLGGISLGIVGLIAWRRHALLGMLTSCVALLIASGFYIELSDRYVGPLIRERAGSSYVVNAYLSMTTCLVLHAVGIATRLTQYVRHRNRGRAE